jgi:integrase
MIELQRWTGMRPGEVTVMRGIDIDTSGAVWHYHPEGHKTEHHGHSRVVDLGPRAQQLIRPFLKADVGAYLFSPGEAEAERRTEQRRRRKTKVQPSQRDRRKNSPRWQPLEHYTTESYRRAIARGCDKANEAAQEAKRLQGLEIDDERLIPRWHPHQLRHSYATRIRKEHGLEAARVLLGHRSMAVTEVYAEVDRSRMAEIVAKSG